MLLLTLTAGPPVEQTAAKRYVAAWAKGDYAAMHAELGEDDQRAVSLAKFTEAYRDAATIATTTAMRPGKVDKPKDGVVEVPMTVVTRVFRTLRATLRLEFSGADDDKRVAWSPQLVFPGLAAGERLSRKTQLPRRATIFARNGSRARRRPGPHVGDPRRRRLDRRHARPAPAGAPGAPARARLPRRRRRSA